MFVFRVLHEHIHRLSKVVTANHKALQIPEVTTCPVLCLFVCVGVLGFGCVCNGERLVCLTRGTVAFLSATAEIPGRKKHAAPISGVDHWLTLPNSVFFSSNFATSVLTVRFPN